MIGILVNKKVVASTIMGLMFVGLHGIASATTYYISNAGSDTNNGTSASTPWKTITKLNASGSALQPGDSVLFNRGETYYGMIVPAKSGTSTAVITYGTYGAGAKPIISGLKPVTGWTSLGGGIFQATANGSSASLNLVTMNNAIQQIGRYPNANQPNGGYLSYEDFSKNATSTPTIGTITDNGSTDTTNWAGAEIAIKKNTWVIERNPIISNSNGTFTYNNPSIYNGIVGYGYFIQRDPRTLDQMGEWYYNNTGKLLQMYFGSNNPSNYNVEVSSLETGFMMSSKSFITIDGLAFQGFNKYGIYGLNGSNNTVKNVDVEVMGEYGIYMWNIPNALVDGAYVNNVLSNGIFIRNASTSGITVRNSTVKNVGMIAGMGKSGDGTYNGISAIGGTGVVVEYNRLEDIGYLPIEFQGNNVVVNNNFIDRFCSVKDDGGGIYTWTVASPSTYVNRVVRDNIIIHGIGAIDGTTKKVSYSVRGIYTDGDTANVKIYNNTVAYVTGGAMNMNSPSNITLTNNTTYRNGDAIHIARFAGNRPLTRNITVTGNIFFPYSILYENAEVDVPTSIDPLVDVQQIGNFNNNKYYINSRIPFNWVHSTSTGAYLNLPAQSIDYWKNSMGHDENSTSFPQTIAPYAVNNVVGTNTVTNSGFTSNINGVTIWGGSYSGSLDTTSKITGIGSLKLTPNVSTPKNTVYLYAPVGGVTVGKKYILKFSTFGTAARGSLTAGIRKTASPYNDLSVRQQDAFGIGREDHEYLIEPTITDAGASYIITVNQPSSPTYIDNIEFYEVNATVNNVYDYTRFEYNDTLVSKTVALNGSYIDAYGTIYTNSVTLAPFKSVILMKTTATVPAVDVTAPTIPSSLIALGSGTSQVRLGWIASTDAIGVIGYKIYRNGTQVATTPNTSYIDSNLTANTTYTYTVAAYDAAGNTSIQAPGVIGKTASLPDTAGPTIPTNVVAVASGTTQIRISWSASTDNVGVVGYKIYKNGLLAGTSTTLNFISAGLTANTTYTYMVLAYDAAGNQGVLSAGVAATTAVAADVTAPSVPSNIVGVAVSTGQIDVSWSASTDAVGVVGYKVFRNGVEVATTANTSYINTGLTANTTYTYTVAAYDAAGNTSTQSAGLNIATLSNPVPTGDVIAPSAPSNLTATTQVKLTWKASTDNVKVIGYKIYRDGVLIASPQSTYTGYNDTTIAGSTTYVYKVAGYDAAGNISAHSNSVTITTIANPDVVAPTVPTNFTAVANSSTQATLSWTASTDNTSVPSYNIFKNGVKVTTTRSTTYVDSGLTPGTTYTYQLSAYDSTLNTSQRTVLLTITTPTVSIDTTAPSIPVNLSASLSAISADSVNLSWSPSTDAVGVAGYNIYRDGVKISSSAQTSYLDITLQPGTYMYQIDAYDAKGNVSSKSTSVSITILPIIPEDTVPPTVPSNFNGVIVSGDQIDLSWNASTDAVGVVGYEIYRDGVKIGSSVTTTYSDLSVSAGNTYSYTILAYDEAGNISSQSTPISLSIPATPTVPVVILDTMKPTTPTNLIKTSGGTRKVSISWNASTDNIGVAGYIIYRNGAKVATVTQTNYTDVSLRSGTTYTYQVYAYDDAKNTSDYASLSVTTKRR